MRRKSMLGAGVICLAISIMLLTSLSPVVHNLLPTKVWMVVAAAGLIIASGFGINISMVQLTGRDRIARKAAALLIWLHMFTGICGLVILTNAYFLIPALHLSMMAYLGFGVLLLFMGILIIKSTPAAPPHWSNDPDHPRWKTELK